MEDVERVRYVTRNFEQLQGLRYAPYGLAMVLFGFMSFLWFAPSSGFFDVRLVDDLVFAGLLVVAMVLHHQVSVYYGRRFGHVRRRSWGEKTRLTFVFWIVIAAVFVLSFFRDWFGQIGLSLLAGAAVAAFVLGDLWVERHRLTAYWAFLAVLAVGVCFLPVFGVFEGRAFPLVAVSLGGILLLGSLLDHLLLVRTLKPMPREDTDVVG